MKAIVLLTGIVLSLTACNSKAKREEAAKQATIDSMNMVMMKSRVIDSIKTAQAANEKRIVEKNAQYSHAANIESGTETKKKKGWSGAAKGAVIGAGTGAVAGAIIKKNAGGAIVGGIIGAGAGAATGAIIDKNKKKKKKSN